MGLLIPMISEWHYTNNTSRSLENESSSVRMSQEEASLYKPSRVQHSDRRSLKGIKSTPYMD